MDEEVRVVDLCRVDNHAVRASQIANIETIGAWEYFGMFARGGNIGKHDITRFIASERDALPLFQMDDLRNTMCYDDECGTFYESSKNIGGKRFCRSWKHQ